LAAGDEVSSEVLEEGCYHLSRLGLSYRRIASHFEITPSQAKSLAASYSARLKSGEVAEGDFDGAFWSSVKKEAEGDMKMTVVSDKGVHHVWKSELQKLDGPSLMAVYEASKDFLGSDPNQKFLDYPAPKGFDPLALDREVRKAVGVIGELLEGKWRGPGGRRAGASAHT
jgi:hypothetical protein